LGQSVSLREDHDRPSLRQKERVCASRWTRDRRRNISGRWRISGSDIFMAEVKAYITGFHNGHCVIQPTDPAVALPVGAALCYSKEWIGLTSDDIHDAFCHAEYEANQDWNDDPEGWCEAFAAYIESKLKEKNT